MGLLTTTYKQLWQHTLYHAAFLSCHFFILPATMSYHVKEIFYTLQGEGLQAGRPAVFCRFAGCNFWNGREADRARAVYTFCDTDFVGTDGTLGGSYRSADVLAGRIASLWPAHDVSHRLVVLTGGEPLLQLDTVLIDALHAQQFRIALETNGSLPVPPGVDWVCVSPKDMQQWVQRSGDELKLVWPQPGMDLDWIRSNSQFNHYLLQPLDNAAQQDNTRLCIERCLADPRWRLSLQTHKITGIR